jgi:hypothetical protein
MSANKLVYVGYQWPLVGADHLVQTKGRYEALNAANELCFSHLCVNQNLR